MNPREISTSPSSNATATTPAAATETAAAEAIFAAAGAPRPRDRIRLLDQDLRHQAFDEDVEFSVDGVDARHRGDVLRLAEKRRRLRRRPDQFSGGSEDELIALPKRQPVVVLRRVDSLETADLEREAVRRVRDVGVEDPGRRPPRRIGVVRLLDEPAIRRRVVPDGDDGRLLTEARAGLVPNRVPDLRPHDEVIEENEMRDRHEPGRDGRGDGVERAAGEFRMLMDVIVTGESVPGAGGVRRPDVDRDAGGDRVDHRVRQVFRRVVRREREDGVPDAIDRVQERRAHPAVHQPATSTIATSADPAAFETQTPTSSPARSGWTSPAARTNGADAGVEAESVKFTSSVAWRFCR